MPILSPAKSVVHLGAVFRDVGSAPSVSPDVRESGYQLTELFGGFGSAPSVSLDMRESGYASLARGLR